MPYIPQCRRDQFVHHTYDYSIDLPKEIAKHVETTGDLNYVISTIIHEYFKRGGRYQHINDILGALEGAKLEFYRRVAEDYEDNKIVENGDIYS